MRLVVHCESTQAEHKHRTAGEIAKYEEMLDEWDERDNERDDVQELIMKLKIVPAEVPCALACSCRSL